MLTYYPSTANKIVTSLVGLEYCINLKYISIDGNGTTGIKDLSPLSKLTDLDFISFPENIIKDITPISGLSQLYYLVLENNRISNIDSITSLVPYKNIKSLYLSGNEIS